MARMRYVKPEFWTDSRMVALSRDARLFYIGTWNFAMCDKGHLEDDPFRLKMQIFPADNVDVRALVDELVASGRLARLTAEDGATYLRIVHLEAHQKADSRWTPRCPACKAAPNLSETPVSLGEALTSGNAPESASDDALTGNPSEPLPNSPQEGRGGDRRGERKTSSTATRRTPASDPDFDAFWAVYPRKEAKKNALKAWATARRDATPARIILGAKRYAGDPNREPQYTALPASWLNAGRWDDEPLPGRDGRPANQSPAPSDAWMYR